MIHRRRSAGNNSARLPGRGGGHEGKRLLFESTVIAWRKVAMLLQPRVGSACQKQGQTGHFHSLANIFMGNYDLRFER